MRQLSREFQRFPRLSARGRFFRLPINMGTWSSRWLLIMALIAAALVAPLPFLPALENGFAEWWDDTAMLVENLAFREITPASLHWMFSTFLIGHYQPLSWLTLAVDYQVWGMNPRGYHLTNLLLHGVNAALFLLLSVKLLAIRAVDSESSRRFRIAGALAGALFFALHPLRAESVAWAIQRRDLLSATFLLATLLAYLSVAGKVGRERAQWLLASLGLYLLSLLSKATGITLGVVLLILDVYPLHRLGDGKQALWSGGPAWRVLAEKIPFLALGAIFAGVAAAAQRDAGAIRTVEQHSLLSRLMQATYGLFFYVWKTVVPSGLSPLYELPQPFSTATPRFLVPLVAIPLVVLTLVACRRRHPWALASFGIYATILLPVLGILQSGVQLVADRYSYVACLPWAVLVGAGFTCAFTRANRAASRLVLPLLAAAAVLLASGLGLLSWQQTRVWKDGFTLWRHVVRTDPQSYLGHHNLGSSYLAHGRPREAEAALRRAVELSPRAANSLNDLGASLGQLGRSEEAAAAYLRAIEVNPNAAFTHYNLGKEYIKLKRRSQAIESFRRALALEPHHVEAHFSLGFALLAGGDLAGARTEQSLLVPLDRTRAEVLQQLIERRNGTH